jgi:hypothetical protein
MDYVWVSSLESSDDGFLGFGNDNNEGDDGHENSEPKDDFESSSTTTSSSSSFWNSVTLFSKSAANYAKIKLSYFSRQTSNTDTTTIISATMRSSTIHRSYDWVSNVRIDGGQLILPGPLIALDDANSSSNNGGDSNIPILDVGGSTTIMVSAHDLLATQQNNNNPSQRPLFTTQPTSIPKALWKWTRQTSKRSFRSVSKMAQYPAAQTITTLQQLEERHRILGRTMGWIYDAACTRSFFLDDNHNDGEHGDHDDDDVTRDASTTIELANITRYEETAMPNTSGSESASSKSSNTEEGLPHVNRKDAHAVDNHNDNDGNTK